MVCNWSGPNLSKLPVMMSCQSSSSNANPIHFFGVRSITQILRFMNNDNPFTPDFLEANDFTKSPNFLLHFAIALMNVVGPKRLSRCAAKLLSHSINASPLVVTVHGTVTRKLTYPMLAESINDGARASQKTLSGLRCCL